MPQGKGLTIQTHSSLTNPYHLFDKLSITDTAAENLLEHSRIVN